MDLLDDTLCCKFATAPKVRGQYSDSEKNIAPHRTPQHAIAACTSHPPCAERFRMLLGQFLRFPHGYVEGPTTLTASHKMKTSSFEAPWQTSTEKYPQVSISFCQFARTFVGQTIKAGFAATLSDARREHTLLWSKI